MKKYLVKPGAKVSLKSWPTDDTGDFKNDDAGRAAAEAETEKILGKLDDLQQLLYVDHRHALLIVLQAMDTGGKDGTIKHVMSGVNPVGCRVASFKVPTPVEAAHDFLWRVHQEVPPKGFIGIFNRSHYEDVLVTRVHGMISDKEAKRRFKEINEFESLLKRANKTTVLKFFLHISKAEQRRRLLARAQDPKKHWKFSLNDLHERKFWPHYQRAYQEAVEATSTEPAPWIIVPSDHKWYRNWVVAKWVVESLEEMKLNYPPPPPGINFKKLRIP